MTLPSLPAPPTGTLRHLTEIGVLATELAVHYHLIADDAADRAREAKRSRTAAPRHVAHWLEVAERADYLHAAALTVARAHHDLVAVTQITALADITAAEPDSRAADVANATLDADETEAALLLAHAHAMREKEPEPEPEPLPVPDDYGYAADGGDTPSVFARLEEGTPSVFTRIGKAMRSW